MQLKIALMSKFLLCRYIMMIARDCKMSLTLSTRISVISTVSLPQRITSKQKLPKLFAPSFLKWEPSLYLDSEQPTPTTTSVIGAGQNSQNNVALPKIHLPTFSGDIEKCPEFFALFQSLIHNSTSLSPIGKFHFLRSNLSGSALSVVSSLQLTGIGLYGPGHMLSNSPQNSSSLFK